MSEKVTGLVVEMNRNRCILMTPDGDFVEAAQPHGRKLNPGEEATLPRYQPFFNQRRLALVACLLIALIGWTAYSSFVPVAVAYVSLDINPSLELAVDRKGEVIRATSFNPEAEALLKQVPVKGKPVTEAIENLIDAAVTLNYINPEKTNEILVTVDIEPEAPASVIDQAAVEDTITRSIAKNNVEAELSVTPVDPTLRQQASEKKVSTGRYLLYQEQLKSQGKPAEVKEIKKIQEKQLNDLGYRSWSPEKIKYLPKNQGFNTGKVNNQTKRNQPENNKNQGAGWQKTYDDDNDNDKNDNDKKSRGGYPGAGQHKDDDSDDQKNDSDQNDRRDDRNQGRGQQSWDQGSKNNRGSDQNDKKDPDSDKDNDNNKSWFDKSRSNWSQKIENIKKSQSEKWQSWYNNRRR
ncbi:MAG: hypothetical protein HPY50_16425 [Firmicutes bacterium]|nr:hypothetical protein [Bacillota bacterium]